MSETTTQNTPNITALKLDVSPENAHPIEGGVGAIESRLRLGRKEAVASGGFVGEAENALKFFGAVAGFGQEGRELDAFADALDKPDQASASDVFNAIVAEKITGRTSEEQLTFLSDGTKSIADATKKLMEERGRSPEFNAKMIGEALSRLKSDYDKATKAEKIAIHDFFENMSKARKESWDAMGHMWDAQMDLDEINKVRATVEIGRDKTRSQQYEFKSSTGKIGKLWSNIRRFIPGGITHAERLLGSVDKVSNREVDTKLASLRLKAKRLGSADEHIEMWKEGIISREELGNVDTTNTKVGLNDEQRMALVSNTNLSEFMTDKDKGGNPKFENSSQARQVDYLHKFFEGYAQRNEHAFVLAREKYLGCDITNSTNWEAILGGVNVSADIILVPQFVKRWAVQLADVGGNGVITIGRGVGGAIQFNLDRMESEIAADGLEKFISVAVAREAAMRGFEDAVKKSKEGDTSIDIVEAALRLRGAEMAYAKAARYVGAVADTVSMTDTHRLALSAIISPVEAARAGIDLAVNGIFVGHHAGEIIRDIKDRMGLLDGETVISVNKEDIYQGELETSVTAILTRAQELGVPDEYMKREDMDALVDKNLSTRFAEFIRKQIGPEGQLLGIGWLLKVKDQEWWKVIAGGSVRQSADDVAGRYGQSFAETQAAINNLTGRVDRMNGADQAIVKKNTLVEIATAVVLKDAQQTLIDADLGQISTRAKLDRMWSRVVTYGAVAASITALTVGVAHADVLANTWASKANIGLGNTLAQLGQMKEAAAKIVSIARQNGMYASQGGVGLDVLVEEIKTGLNELNTGAADLISNNFMKIELTGLIATGLVSLAAVLPGAGELLPGRTRMRTTFLGPTGKVS